MEEDLYLFRYNVNRADGYPLVQCSGPRPFCSLQSASGQLALMLCSAAATLPETAKTPIAVKSGVVSAAPNIRLPWQAGCS